MRRYFGYVLAAGLTGSIALFLLTRTGSPGPGGVISAGPDDRTGLRRAAEAGIRLASKDPDTVRFRGEQVYPQAVAGQTAVCGQANVFGTTSQSFVPFVALMGVNAATDDAAQRYRILDTHIASSVSEADHTYLETVARCYDGGGPQHHAGITPVPPLPEHPNAVQRASTAPPDPPRPPVTAARPPIPAARPPSIAVTEAGTVAPAGSRTVTMRQNGNIRTTPHGETIRVAPKGASMRVFAEAPGGWLEVGDAAPFGWVHTSMVER